MAPKSTRPHDERAATPEPVAEPAGGQQRAGEDEQVGVHDPLQLPRGGPELGGQAGQGDVHDQPVERGHEHGDTHHREDQPPRRVPRGVVGVGGWRPGDLDIVNRHALTP